MNFLSKSIVGLVRNQASNSFSRSLSSQIDWQNWSFHKNEHFPGDSIEYIEQRVNNMFNIILADINSAQQFNAIHNKPNLVFYCDPYKSKDQILQDLVKDSELNRNYHIQELIEDEFQLEISDREFDQFKTLRDIVDYVNRRLEIRKQLLNTHSPEYMYDIWY